MKVALFGATGGTGSQFLQQALAAGHEVRALARDPEKLPGDSPALSIVAGDVREATAVAKTIAGTDAVVSALGTRQGDDPIEAVSTRHILDAMKTHSVDRLIVVTSLGVGDSEDQVPFFFKMLMKTALRKVMAAKNEQEAMIKDSRLAWTIIRPGGLTDGELTKAFSAGTDKSITAGQVSRADVAYFMLHELETGEYVHQTPAIT